MIISAILKRPLQLLTPGECFYSPLFFTGSCWERIEHSELGHTGFINACCLLGHLLIEHVQIYQYSWYHNSGSKSGFIKGYARARGGNTAWGLQIPKLDCMGVNPGSASMGYLSKLLNLGLSFLI